MAEGSQDISQARAVGRVVAWTILSDGDPTGLDRAIAVQNTPIGQDPHDPSYGQGFREVVACVTGVEGKLERDTADGVIQDMPSLFQMTGVYLSECRQLNSEALEVIRGMPRLKAAGILDARDWMVRHGVADGLRQASLRIAGLPDDSDYVRGVVVAFSCREDPQCDYNALITGASEVLPPLPQIP